MIKIIKGFSVLLFIVFLGIHSTAVAQAVEPTNTTQTTDDDDDDDNGKIGLVGLLGLLGLLGLRRNKTDERKYTTTNTPR